MAEDAKDLGGRPPIHTDPEQVETLVRDYFDWIEGEYKDSKETVTDDEGKESTQNIRTWTRKPEPPTVTGLALHIGFCHKSSLYDYSKKDGFSDPIKKGLTRIEKYHEIKAAYGDKCVGNIFVLKNFGWKDSHSIDHTTKGEALNLTPEQRAKKIQELKSKIDDK